eukprot:5458958-Amphidinium_carterae.1
MPNCMLREIPPGNGCSRLSEFMSEYMRHRLHAQIVAESIVQQKGFRAVLWKVFFAMYHVEA